MATVTKEDRSRRLTHLRSDGTAQMVDVSGKPETTREATATATVNTTAEVLSLLTTGHLPKGDALAVARVAGIMAAKKTPDLIPLCHPLPISKVTVDFTLGGDTITVLAVVRTRGVTGVEMEALTAASVAALSVYDTIKAVDKNAVLTGIKVLAKSGGKSGGWSELPGDPKDGPLRANSGEQDNASVFSASLNTPETVTENHT
jgi:cyclic pyranopterin phosphate synthase